MSGGNTNPFDSPPLRVTHVVLSLDVGGMERNVVNQVRLGPSIGQEVSVLCVEHRGALADRTESLGGRVLSIGKRPGFQPGIARGIRAALRELRPDVIHTHQIGPLFYTGLACIGLPGPLIVHTEHGKVDYAGRRRTRWLGRTAARFAEIFYCLSRDMADAVAAAGVVPPQKLRVIRNGIDTAFYAEPRDTAAVRRAMGVPETAPLIGTVGRLTEVKRQDVLLEAFARVSRTCPEAHLVLVGDGPLASSLRDQASRLGVADRVHFTGYQADTTPYLHAMDVFTLTSRSEGMPQSLLEACVAEVPAICSRVGGIPEVLEDGETGSLFPAGDAERLATGISALLADRERAAAMASAAHRRVVAQFDVGRMAAEYHGHFVELLTERRRQLTHRTA